MYRETRDRQTIIDGLMEKAFEFGTKPDELEREIRKASKKRFFFKEYYRKRLEYLLNQKKEIAEINELVAPYVSKSDNTTSEISLLRNDMQLVTDFINRLSKAIDTNPRYSLPAKEANKDSIEVTPSIKKRLDGIR